MNFPSLSVIPKAFGDALARLFSGVAVLTSGMALTVNGAGSLQINVAAGTGTTGTVPFSYAGGNVLPTNGALQPRYDLIVVASGAVVPSIVPGIPAAAPLPPSLPAGALLLGIAFISANALDFTTGSFLGDYTMPFAPAAPWTDFAPTVTQNGVRTITILYCRYHLIGKSVTVQGYITITNAGTAGFGIQLASWPAAIAPRLTAATSDDFGSFIYNRAGTVYVGVAFFASATSISFIRGGNADTAVMGAAGGGNFATVNGDTLSFNLSYEIA